MLNTSKKKTNEILIFSNRKKIVLLMKSKYKIRNGDKIVLNC